MNYVEYNKALKTLLGLIVLSGIVGTILLYTYHRATISPKAPENSAHTRLPTTRVEIRGMAYDGNLDGERVISIRADRFSIEKKKLGFLRFGLLNAAKFENAFIQVYGQSGVPEKGDRKIPPGLNQDKFNGSRQSELSFKGAFSKKALPTFPIKNISSVIMEPVTVELHNEKAVVTRISASSADLRLKRKRITFKGNVTAVSGDRRLTADRVDFFPEHGVIKTGGQFTLRTPLKKLEGNRLTADIFLNPLQR